MNSLLSRSRLNDWSTFTVLLAGTLVLSVSVLPVLPWFLAPQLIPLAMTAAALDERLDLVNRWALWGGLTLDLLAPTRFGVVWLGLLAAAAVLHGLRRVSVAAELPWLWPLWFFVPAAVAHGYLALSWQLWQPWLLAATATAGWGVIVIGFRQWINVTRSTH